MNRLSLVWSPSYFMEQSPSTLAKLTSSQLVIFPHFMELKGSLLQSQVQATFQSLPVPFFILGVSQMGHKTRPGHCNMQQWRFSSDWSCMYVFLSLSYSTLFQSDFLPPPSELVLLSCKCRMLLSALGRNMRNLCEWGTGSEGGAVSCHVGSLLQVSLLFSSLERTLSESCGWLCMGRIWPGWVQKVDISR
jgi:hypothetical protein